MAANERRSSLAAPGNQDPSSCPASQLNIPEQNLFSVKQLEIIEAWHKKQRFQFGWIRDKLRLELQEPRRRRQKEKGNDEEANTAGANAAIALQESMKNFREQLEIRRQRVEAINVLLRRRSELLKEGGGRGGEAAGLTEEMVASVKQLMFESASYLPVLLRAMERRLILRAEVESVEPPAFKGVCVGQRAVAAPVRLEGSADSPKKPGKTTTVLQGTKPLASEPVYARRLPEAKIPGPQSSVVATVQETEDFASSYESMFSFLPEQNRRTVVNLEEIDAWYTKEWLQIAGIQSSLFSELQRAQEQDDQEGGDEEHHRSQGEAFRGAPSPSGGSNDQRLAEYLERILGQQMVLRQGWALVDELLCERSEMEQDGSADATVREGDEQAACARRWMEEITTDFQLLIRAMLRRCLLKAEVEFLEPPLDEDGSCS